MKCENHWRQFSYISPFNEILSSYFGQIKTHWIGFKYFVFEKENLQAMKSEYITTTREARDLMKIQKAEEHDAVYMETKSQLVTHPGN